MHIICRSRAKSAGPTLSQDLFSHSIDSISQFLPCYILPVDSSSSMVRLKNRYILFELMQTKGSPDQKKVLESVRQSLELNFGTVASGLLASSMYIKYYSEKTGKGILQADRAHFRLAWAALTFAQLEHGGFIRSIGVSGTIRKAEERLIRFDQKDLFLKQFCVAN